MLNDTVIRITIFALAGLLSGSVMSMVVHRLPIMIHQDQETHATFNLWWPGSHCCHCHHPLALRDNIPLLSWLMLRGKCRYCRSRIPFRYPLLELSCLLAAPACALIYSSPLIACTVFLYFWFALALSVIDFRTLLLPDKLTLPLLWLGLLINTTYGFIPLGDAIYGSAVGYAALWLVYWLAWLITRKEGLGYGDFKLLAAAGAWCGWQALPAILLAASLCGIMYAIGQKVRCASHGPMIAFGPWLALSSWLYYCWLMY